MTNHWDIFDALTSDHPMLADIEPWMLPPHPEEEEDDQWFLLYALALLLPSWQ